jgi:hypothetical protein
MQTRIIDLNCKDKEYNFNLSIVSEIDWKNFAHDIVLAKGGMKADNTTFVGTIAGTLSDSALVNVDISSG